MIYSCFKIQQFPKKRMGYGQFCTSVKLNRKRNGANTLFQNLSACPLGSKFIVLIKH